ncbi:hypothetical protein MAH4_09650 [Sessilibacter sp. MAH4]
MYNQLTYEERVTFSTLKLQGLSIRKIATLDWQIAQQIDQRIESKSSKTDSTKRFSIQNNCF